ncbi:MAG TPA: hypothetical protein VM124_03155 [Candidatus Limnocylindrales bacterium]|nr:hypothetical protein [Candidatus Limnocylindrales bacterium]
MKQAFVKKYLIILAIAFMPSILAFRIHSVDNVPFCIHAAGCSFNLEPKGKVTERHYGYPLSYKATSTFTLKNNNQSMPNYAGYAEATAEQQALSIVNIVLNVIFWFALLKALAALLPARKLKQPREPADQG